MPQLPIPDKPGRRPPAAGGPSPPPLAAHPGAEPPGEGPAAALAYFPASLAGAVASVLFAALAGRVPELLAEAHRLRELERLAAEANNADPAGGES